MRQHLARLHLMRGREDAAVKLLQAVADRDDLDRDLAWKLAETELAMGHDETAAKILSSIFRRFRSVRALLRQTEIVSRLEGPRAAAGLLQQAQGLAPSCEEVRLRAAREALAAGLLEKAIESLDPLLRMHPTVAEYPYLLGEARARQEKLDEAEALWHRAVELEATFVPVRLALARLYLRGTRHDEARRELDEVLRLDPENVEAKALLDATRP
jgi:predicted Zn-dependent protease